MCVCMCVCNIIVWSGYSYQTIYLICLHSTKYSTIILPWVFRVEFCLYLRRGFLRSNPASGCVADLQGRVLVRLPNAVL